MSADFTVIVIIGPSGVGKSTIVGELQKLSEVQVVPTWTDRPKRKDEQEIEHRFVGRKVFDKKQNHGFFLEVVQPFSLEYRYGLPRIEKSSMAPLVILRAAFIPLMKKYYPNCIVYQIESDKKIATEAMSQRSADEKWGTRAAQFEKEVIEGRDYANRVYIRSKINNSARIAHRMANDLMRDLQAL